MSPSGPVLQQQQREMTGPCMEYVLHVVDSRRTELDPLFFLHYFLEEEKERESCTKPVLRLSWPLPVMLSHSWISDYI